MSFNADRPHKKVSNELTCEEGIVGPLRRFPNLPVATVPNWWEICPPFFSWDLLSPWLVEQRWSANGERTPPGSPQLGCISTHTQLPYHLLTLNIHWTSTPSTP